MKAQKKILIVDAGKGVYNQLNEQQNLSVVYIQPDKNKKIYDIAEDIAGKIKKESPEAILINLEGGYENTSRPELKGMELIYWLRLKYNYTGSIITYGFLAPEQILRLKPEYVVIHAPGNKHLRLPFDVNELIDAVKPANLEADKLLDIYRPYAEKLVNLHKARHERANWWAIKVMWDIDDVRKGKIEPYPDYVQEKLKELNNFLINTYYKKKIEVQDIFKILNEKLNDKINELLPKLKSKEQKINNLLQDFININLNTDIKKTITKIIILYEEYLLLIAHLRNEYNKYKFLLKQYNDEEIEKNKEIKGLLEQIKIVKCIEKKYIKKRGLLRSKIKNRYSDPKVYINTIIQGLNKIEKEDCVDSKNQTKNQTYYKKALIIDDNNEPWQAIYSKLFGDYIEFSSISFGSHINNQSSLNNKLDTLFTLIEKKITNEIFIILDLRLFPEDENKLGISSSGFEVLKFLKNRYPHIPVLITTASNKIWSLKKALKENADNYWIKEGFDNLFSADDSIFNFLELQTIVRSFTSKEYRILKSLSYLIFKIQTSQSKFWWEEMKWEKIAFFSKSINNPEDKPVEPTLDAHKLTTISREQVVSLLKDAESIMKQYVKNKFIFGSIEFQPYNQLVNLLSKFIEWVHPLSKINGKAFSPTNVIDSRGDRIGKHLYQYRQKTTHGSDSIGIVEFQKFFNSDERNMDFYTYLTYKKLKLFENIEDKQKKLSQIYLNRN